MARTKLKFRLHRAVIVLFCLALLVALMQGASWFSQNHQRQRNPQLEELARTLARQVTLNVAPLMRTDSPDEKRIQAILDQLTDESRILDAGVYDEQGDLIARSGESVEVRDRLALDGKKAGGYFNQQIVEPIAGKNGPLGYLRLTLDTHTLATEAQQVDNTTNILRLMLLLSLAIGVVLTRTLTDLPGCDIYTSLDEALAHCSKDEDIYIIGGASVYVQALECADRLCLTEVHDTPADADAFFPEFKGWKETMREEHTTDEKHHQSYAFVDYVRKKQTDKNALENR